MALKRILTTPPTDAHKAFYREDGPGRWVLDLEESPAPEETPEEKRTFRENNIALKKQNEAMAARLEGLEKGVASLLQKLGGDAPAPPSSPAAPNAAPAPKGNEAGDIDPKLKHALEMFERKTQELQAAQEKAEAAQLAVKRSEFERELLAEANKRNLRPDAQAALLRAAREQFAPHEGRFVPQKDGKPRYSSKGTEVMAPAEWLEEVKSTEPFYFAQPQGGNAQGNLAGSFSSAGKKEVTLAQSGNYLEQIAAGEVVVSS